MSKPPLTQFFDAVFSDPHCSIAGMKISGGVICGALSEDLAVTEAFKQLNQRSPIARAEILSINGVVPELVARGHQADIVRLMEPMSPELRGQVMAEARVAELLAEPIAPSARSQERIANTEKRALVLAR